MRLGLQWGLLLGLLLGGGAPAAGEPPPSILAAPASPLAPSAASPGGQSPAEGAPGASDAANPSRPASALPTRLPRPRAEEFRAAVDLTPARAAQLALASSPRVTQALARFRQASEQAEIVASPARPQASLTADGQYRQDPAGPPVTAVITPITPPGPSQRVKFELQATDYPRFVAELELRKLLFDGGRMLSRVEQARASALQSEQLAVADWNRLYLDVRLAYLDVLEARGNQETELAGLERARRHLHVAEVRYDAGAVPRADVLVARLPVSEAELSVTRALHRLHQAVEALNRLVGLPMDTGLKLEEPALPGELAEGLAASLEAAIRARPELLAARADVVSAQEQAMAARRDNNLQLYAVGALRPTFYGGINSTPGYHVGVELSWPFLDGNQHVHLEQQALAREAQARAYLLDMQHQVEQELRQAYREVELTAQTYDTAQVQMTQAEESLQVAERQYQVGRVPITALRDAGVDLTRARANRWKCYYDYLRARARLEWARGDRPEIPLDTGRPLTLPGSPASDGR